MTNEELKKKIVEVVLNSEITGIQIRAIMGGVSTANSIADALIAAGLRFGENLTATFDRMALEREHELERCFAEATKAKYVYERALYYATLNGETADEVKYNEALKRAQKDFAENKGD